MALPAPLAAQEHAPAGAPPGLLTVDGGLMVWTLIVFAAIFTVLAKFVFPAILGAVRDAGKIGKVKIVAFDEEDETLGGIKEGAIFATVVQQPFEFGYQSMKLMAKILDGDRSGIPASKQIFVPTLAIKKTEVEEFTKKIQTLRGR